MKSNFKLAPYFIMASDSMTKLIGANRKLKTIGYLFLARENSRSKKYNWPLLASSVMYRLTPTLPGFVSYNSQRFLKKNSAIKILICQEDHIFEKLEFIFYQSKFMQLLFLPFTINFLSSQFMFASSCCLNRLEKYFLNEIIHKVF